MQTKPKRPVDLTKPTRVYVAPLAKAAGIGFGGSAEVEFVKARGAA
jgi:hypothetical protein